MRRRSPPTALRLAVGPTPLRSQPRHVLPSIPPPTFQYYSNPFAIAPAFSPPPRHVRLPSTELPFIPSDGWSGSSSPISADGARGKMVRGPWDHSGGITLNFDVANVLAPLKPAATTSSSLANWLA